MSTHLNGRACALAALVLLAACTRNPQTNEAANEALTNVTSVPADERAAANRSVGTLIPPAPGEPGGLPDDRRPLDESAARNPTSVAASGATIEQFGFALGEQRYGDAYRFWADDGRRSA